METHLQLEHRLGTVERVERNPFLLERSRGSIWDAPTSIWSISNWRTRRICMRSSPLLPKIYGGATHPSRQFRNCVKRGSPTSSPETSNDWMKSILFVGSILMSSSRANSSNTSTALPCSSRVVEHYAVRTHNLFSLRQMLFAIRKRSLLLNREAIHPDQTLMWSPAALTKLVTGNGFAIKEFLVYGSGPCVNFTRRESIARNLARLMLRSVDVGIRQILRFRPWLNNPLIVVAQRSEEPSTTALRLQ